MAYQFVSCHEHFENMAALQSIIDEENEKAARALQKVASLQYEMEQQERAHERVLINERLQDLHEEFIDAEFEDVPTFSVEKRTKKVAKASKKVDRKLVLNILNSNSKTTDKLPRFIIQQTLHSRTKPKYKNHGF
jgi:hypothetical protein